MIDLAQGIYTHEEVLKMLKSSRKIGFKYYLLDKDEKNIGEIHTARGAIDNNNQCEIARTASFTIKEAEYMDINRTDERIRPVFCLSTPTGWLEYALGTFIMSSPRRRMQDNSIYWDIECYDYSLVLKEDRVTSRYYIGQSEYYLDAIKKILQTANITKLDIENTEYKTPYPLEFEIGTSKLEIVNNLLAAINYLPLHFNNYGFATSRRYIEPTARRVQHIYRTDKESIIREGGEQGLDLFNVPNIFVRFTENPDGEEYWAEYKNEDPANPLSTVRRGRNIVDIEIVDDIVDQRTLEDYTKRMAIEKSQIYEDIYLPTALMPNHGYNDCVFVQDNKLEINTKYIEESWKMQLELGGTMSHKLRKVVAFNDVL